MASRQRIEQQVAVVQRALGVVRTDADWPGTYYQSANRIAHLFFWLSGARVPAWLISLYFVGDQAQQGPASVAAWEPVQQEVRDTLALPRHHMLNSQMISVFAPAGT